VCGFSFPLVSKLALADPCAAICSKLLTARFCREKAYENRSFALQGLAAPKKSEGPARWIGRAAPEAFRWKENAGFDFTLAKPVKDAADAARLNKMREPRRRLERADAMVRWCFCDVALSRG
jgi:hypothetical protein